MCLCLYFLDTHAYQVDHCDPSLQIMCTLIYTYNKRVECYKYIFRTATNLPKQPKWTTMYFLIEISLGKTQSLSLSVSLPLPSQQLSSLAGCQPVSGSAGDPNAGLLKPSHILPHVYHRLPHSSTETRRHGVLAHGRAELTPPLLRYGI